MSLDASLPASVPTAVAEVRPGCSRRVLRRWRRSRRPRRADRDRGCDRAGGGAASRGGIGSAGRGASHAPAANPAVGPVSARQSSTSAKAQKKNVRTKTPVPGAPAFSDSSRPTSSPRGRPLQERQRRQLRGPGRRRKAEAGPRRGLTRHPDAEEVARQRKKWRADGRSGARDGGSSAPTEEVARRRKKWRADGRSGAPTEEVARRRRNVACRREECGVRTEEVARHPSTFPVPLPPSAGGGLGRGAHDSSHRTSRRAKTSESPLPAVRRGGEGLGEGGRE